MAKKGVRVEWRGDRGRGSGVSREERDELTVSVVGTEQNRQMVIDAFIRFAQQLAEQQIANPPAGKWGWTLNSTREPSECS